MPSNMKFNGDKSLLSMPGRLEMAFRRIVGFTATSITALVACTTIISLNGDVPAKQSSAAAIPFAQIARQGHLHVAIPSGYLHWFDGDDGLSGLEYDLLHRFADSQGLTLKLHRAANSQQALALLEAGRVQIAAGSITQALIQNRPLRASISFLDNRYQLVSADGFGPVEHLSQLVGRQVIVSAGSNSIQTLQTATSANPLLRWQISAHETDEDLLARLSRGEVDATITDTRTALIMQHHYPELNLGYLFSDTHPVIWALRHDCDPELEFVLNQFINRELRHGTLAMLKERYTDPATQQNYFNLIEFRSRITNILPRYRHMFVDAASQTDSDWRLLAALSYQESMWNPLAESPTGVQGLMQLTKDTADYLKVDRNDPADSIDGAARYLKRLRSRLPSTIQEPDRTWLALASYNLGPGHVDDVLQLTAERGGNADRWIDVKGVLPLLEDAEVAKTTRHGKARGNEALAHVNRVRSFYQVLTRLEDTAETRYQADIIREIETNPSFVAVTTEGRAVVASDSHWAQAIDNHPAPGFVSRAMSDALKPEAITHLEIQTQQAAKYEALEQKDRVSSWTGYLLNTGTTYSFTEQLTSGNDGSGFLPVPDNGLFPLLPVSDDKPNSTDQPGPSNATSASLSDDVRAPSR